ncbi:MAG: plastoquinol--plastocyanin reductase [Calditrichaeota bacterium]|nr:MAG: plastoquinol--plastocyanin reductase [Calditrichota bacterium]
MAFNRRAFLNTILGGGVIGWLGSIFYPVISFLIPPKIPEANVQSVNAGSIADIALNSSQILKFGRTPVLLIRSKTGEFKALAATCTHLDCTVQYRQDRQDIWCACHNGIYNLSGRNLSGPPPKPLSEYLVNIIDKEVIISKPKQMG